MTAVEDCAQKQLDLPKSHGSFDRLQSFVVDENLNITLSRWRSRESGLSVVHIEYDGTRHFTR